MPFLKTIKCDLNRHFSFQFSTPTQDISIFETTLQYLNPSVSYSLIPGIQNTSLLDPERLLLQILPFTKNCMVDISMPFIEITKKKNAVKHYGRYIICNKQLVGVKIRPSDHWPKSKTINHEISANIQNFYREQGISNYQREIPIGEFLIVTKHFKMVPFFASELSSMFENTTIQILNDYYSLGCQIFSIVNDLTEQKKRTLKDPFDILKNYRRQSTITIYCGMHLALDLTEIYKTKSYASQTSNKIKKIHVNKLDQIYTQQFTGDLNQTKRARKLNTFQDSKPLTSDVEILDCSHLRIRFAFDRVESNSQSKYEEPMDVQEDQGQASVKQNDLILYFWYIYVNVNKKKPFILPCPMNDKDQNILKKLIKLSDISNVAVADLVQFMKLDSKVKIPKKYENHNFKSIFLDRISARQTETYYLYFSLKQRMSINNIQKDQTFLHQIEKRVINCSGCINEQILKIIEGEAAFNKSSVADEDQKFVEKFIKRKNGLSLQLFYFEIAKYYPRTKISLQFLQKMYECLQNKVRKGFFGTSFQNFVLQSTFNQIRHIFAESQLNFFNKETNFGLKTEYDQIQTQQHENQQNNFRSFIKKVKYHCNAQKKSNFVCHICNSMFHRKEKLSYGRLCIGCNNFVCYSCFDIKTGETAQSQENFQQCLICLNKCDCQKCMKKKPRFQTNYPPRSSLFRNSTGISNSIQNIGMNIEENCINGEGNIKETFVKSQYPLKGETTSLTNLTIINYSAPNFDQTSVIKPCWTCQLSNRLDRNITFQCNICKDIRCLSCEKGQNSKRSWVLRGFILCNKCFLNETQNNGFKIEMRNLKGKIVALEHEISLFQRQKLKSQIFRDTNQFGQNIFQEGHQYDILNNQEKKQQKGGMTPIFDRSSNLGNKGKQSPNLLNGKKNLSENGSIASFGGNKNQNKHDQGNDSRKNSSNSSVSRSVASRRSQPQQKQKQKHKNNSPNSERNSEISFQNKKPIRTQSNSSRNSNRSSAKANNSNRQSVESGQYQQSSSSQKHEQKPKPDWKKNYHQNQNNDQRNLDNSRGGYRGARGRGRGRGRGGHQSQSFEQRHNKPWDNSRKEQQQDFNSRQYQNNKKWESNNSGGDNFRQDYNNNRQGGKERFNERDNSYSNDKPNDNKRQQNKIDDQQKNYYLGKVKSNYSDQDFDY